MFAAVLLVVGALLIPPTPAIDGCSDVTIIGARGSGQTGLGDQVADVTEASTQRLVASGRSVRVIELDYPAISITDSFGLALINGDYASSVREGAENLAALLGDLEETCPDTDVVVIGYSQGAQVVKATFASSIPSFRVAAIALLADPTRTPVAPGLLRIGASESTRGGTFGAIELPDHLRPVAVDACAIGDGICERGGRDLRAHVDGYAELSDDVADAILRELDERLRGTLRFF